MSNWTEVRINGLFHLVIHGVYCGYNPLFLTFYRHFQQDIRPSRSFLGGDSLELATKVWGPEILGNKKYVEWYNRGRYMTPTQNNALVSGKSLTIFHTFAVFQFDSTSKNMGNLMTPAWIDSYFFRGPLAAAAGRIFFFSPSRWDEPEGASNALPQFSSGGCDVCGIGTHSEYIYIYMYINKRHMN